MATSPSGFRAPNADQINGFFENAVQFYKTIPNPNLKPEKSRTFELGTKGRLDNLTYDAAVFTGTYKDFIEDRRQVAGNGTAASPLVFQSVNFSNVRISGFEFKGEVDWGRVGGGRFSSPFGYGQASGKNTDNNAPLNSVDPAKLSVALKYDTAAWDVRFGVTHRKAKDASDIDNTTLVTAPATQFATPSSTVFDLSGQWRISKGLRMTAAIYSLTDRSGASTGADVRSPASNGQRDRQLQPAWPPCGDRHGGRSLRRRHARRQPQCRDQEYLPAPCRSLVGGNPGPDDGAVPLPLRAAA